MTLGVVLCVKSSLSSSVISSLPFWVFSLAGPISCVPEWTIGGYTIANELYPGILPDTHPAPQFRSHAALPARHRIAFGWLIDPNMALTAGLECTTRPSQIFAQFAGCTIMGIGIAFEVRCGSVTMPGEGISITVSQVTKRPFAKVKIWVDTTLVLPAVAGCYLFSGAGNGMLSVSERSSP